jgi:hypothetical protein
VKKLVYPVLGVIFIVFAIADLYSNPNFGSMTLSQKLFTVRFVIYIGLFIGGSITLAALKQWVASAFLGMIAFAILASTFLAVSLATSLPHLVERWFFIPTQPTLMSKLLNLWITPPTPILRGF